VSCREILQRDPDARSGSYPIAGGRVVECDMEPPDGGWTLLYRLRDDDPCPSPWVAASAGGCIRPEGAAQASVFVEPPHGYRELRGTVRAYGYGASDAFRDSVGVGIDSVYVDGLSLTAGSPRTHLFTFAHALTPAFAVADATAACPCAGGTSAPAFVGANYRCEEPRRSVEPDDTTNRFFDTTDILFDGLELDPGCVGAAESAPDFYRALAAELTAPLELRLLSRDETYLQSGITGEDLALIHVELWGR
jgi:hypothetical protein